MQSEHKRVKHGEQPGDVWRSIKIAMRECGSGKEIEVFPWQVLGPKAIRTFKRYMMEKGRKVQRRRDKQAILEGIPD